MSIEFACPCGKRFRVADHHAGRKMRCKACQQIVQIPGVSSNRASVTPTTVRPSLNPASTLSPLPDEWYVHSHDGNDYGPVTKQELDGWLAEGLFTPHCQIRQSGADWQAAQQIYPQLAEDDASAAPAENFPALQNEPFGSGTTATSQAASTSGYQPILTATGKKKSMGNLAINGEVKRLPGTTLRSSDIYRVGEPRSLLERLQAGTIVGYMKVSEVDVDQLQLFRLSDALGEYSLIVPFDNGMIAPLEYVAVLPGRLSSAITLFKQSGGKVALEAGALMGGPLGSLLSSVGSQVTSVWAGCAGDVPPLAQAANAQAGLSEGIRWEGKIGGGPVSNIYRIHWGVQAIPLSDSSFLLAAQSVAKQKMIGFDFGITWFAQYRKTFANFIAGNNAAQTGGFEFYDPGFWLPVSAEVLQCVQI